MHTPELQAAGPRYGRVARAAAAVACAGSLYAPVHHAVDTHRHKLDEARIAAEAACPAPSDDSLATVTDIISSQPPDERPGNIYTVGPSEEDERHEAAAASGLKLPEVDDDRFSELWASAADDIQLTPFNTYKDFTQDILRQHGIELTLGIIFPYEQTTVDVPSADELESSHGKKVTLKIADFFAQQPIGFLAQNGIKRISITAKDNESLGFAILDQGSIGLNIRVMSDHRLVSGVLGHEVSHLMDEAYCDPASIYIDPEFAGTNNESTYTASYNMPTDEFLSFQPEPYEDRLEKYRELSRLAMIARFDGNPGAYCLNSRYAKQSLDDAEMTNAYSYRSIGEDKANIGAMLLDRGKFYEAVDSESPVLQQKARLLLARMYERSPRVVRYYARLSDNFETTEESCIEALISSTAR